MTPTYLHPIAQRNRRRNFAAFIVDYVLFGVGITMVSGATTVPAFAAELTDSKVIIGTVSAVWTGAWLVPQLFAARFVASRPRKYPIMLLGQLIGRPTLGLFVVWLLLGGASRPALTLGLFIAMLAAFMLTDAPVVLAWSDLFGKALPPEARGRLVGLGQALSGLAGVGAGALIRVVLGPAGPAFPLNYALIFGLGMAAFAISIAACALIVEVPEEVDARPQPLAAYLPELGRLLRRNPAFGRITLVRVLAGLGSLATAFYVVHATDVLRLPASAIGLFTGAITVGSVLAGLVLGSVAARSGSHRAVQIGTWAQFSVPVLALLAHVGAFGSAVVLLYPLIFVCIGLFEGTIMLGFINYVLELAPPGQRPTYLGLTNTISGGLIVLPLVGGAVLQWTSYPVLFGIAAVGTLAAAVLALRLPRVARAEEQRAPA